VIKIVICTKQVPSVEDVTFNPNTHTLVREGVPNEINPFDRRALGKAAELKKQRGAEVVAVTMGPPQAVDVLIECLAGGADRAVHIVDRLLAGSDTLVTARVLAAFLARERPDIVFCGKYSVDAETGQVGPEIAELLGWSQVTGATSLELDEDEGTAIIGRETDVGIDTVQVALPVLVTASERLIRPPRISPEMFNAVKDHPVERLSAADLGFAAEQVGLLGSPTFVSEISSERNERQPRVMTVDEDDPARVAHELVDELGRRGLFGRWLEEEPPLSSPGRNAGSSERAVWAIAELQDGVIHPTSLELLGGASDVATEIGGQVAAVVLGHDVRTFVPHLAAHGAEMVYVADAAQLAEMDPEVYCEVLARAIQVHHPWAVLAPASSSGREYLPRVAARLGLGLTGDAIGLTVKDGQLEQLKPAFGGNIVAPILSRTFPQMATVRPGALEAKRAQHAAEVRVVLLSVEALPPARIRLIRREVQAGSAATRLEHSDIVVVAGAGLAGQENLSYVYELAEALDAGVGATRRVVDAGWLPSQQQVGLTGKVVAPKLYVGVAVRGAFNHVVGIQKAHTIVAINNDPQAPIFSQADFGVVGDYRTFVPALVEAVRSARSKAISRGRASPPGESRNRA
jgi:electron transfer flavoprotein alpha subunit